MFEKVCKHLLHDVPDGYSELFLGFRIRCGGITGKIEPIHAQSRRRQFNAKTIYSVLRLRMNVFPQMGMCSNKLGGIVKCRLPQRASRAPIRGRWEGMLGQDCKTVTANLTVNQSERLYQIGSSSGRRILRRHQIK